MSKDPRLVTSYEDFQPSPQPYDSDGKHWSLQVYGADHEYLGELRFDLSVTLQKTE